MVGYIKFTLPFRVKMFTQRFTDLILEMWKIMWNQWEISDYFISRIKFRSEKIISLKAIKMTGFKKKTYSATKKMSAYFFL